MAYLGVNPSERVYKQTPIYKAAAGETLLPIPVGSPDSLLLRNGVILTKDVSNPADYDWSVDPATNRPRLVKGAVAGDEFTFIEFAGVTLPDMLSKSRTNQQLAESPYVAAPPSQPMQLATMAEATKGSITKNQIINPCFQINQRARVGLSTSVTAASAYGIDMWQSATVQEIDTATMTQSVGYSDADVLAGKIPYPYYGIFKSVASNPNSAGKVTCALAQRIENYLWAANQTVTLSFYVKGEVAGNIGVAFGNIAANTSVLKTKYPLIARVPVTTDWRRVQFTFKMPDLNSIGVTSDVNSRRLSFEICTMNINDTTTNPSDLYDNLLYQNNLYITGVQLELGSVATDFIPPSPSEEERKCQRYFQAAKARFYSANNTYMGGTIILPTPMRTTPTVSYRDYNGVANKITGTSGSVSITSGSIAADTIRMDVDCTLTAASTTWWKFFYALSAEL